MNARVTAGNKICKYINAATVVGRNDYYSLNDVYTV